MAAAGAQAAGKLRGKATEGLNEVAAETFGVTQGVFGDGEQGEEVALKIEISIEEDASKGRISRVTGDSVETVAGAERGDEGRGSEG